MFYYVYANCIPVPAEAVDKVGRHFEVRIELQLSCVWILFGYITVIVSRAEFLKMSSGRSIYSLRRIETRGVNDLVGAYRLSLQRIEACTK